MADSRGTQSCTFCGKTQHDVKKLIAGPGVFICDECVDLCVDVLKDELKVARRAAGSPTPRDIVAHLDTFVIGQAHAKRVLAVAVHNHYKRLAHFGGRKDGDVEIAKSNVLLIGPTGSGKTFLAQVLAKFLDVPFAVADATTLTEAGYVGEDVENIILKLVQAADHNIERAQRGIVYVDEIDKITRRSDSPSLTRDVSGEGVQQCLLKIMEGTVCSVPPQGGRKHPSTEYLQVDTSNILFICGGAFSGLDRTILARTQRSGIGFGADVLDPNSKRQGDVLRSVEPDDLVKFGLIPEFVGRLPIVATLDDLDEAALVEILTKPRNALVKQYAGLLAAEGVKLTMPLEAAEIIARRAIGRKTGARGLRSIMESILLETMFSLPGQTGIEEIVISAAAAQGLSEPEKVMTRIEDAA